MLDAIETTLVSSVRANSGKTEGAVLDKKAQKSKGAGESLVQNAQKLADEQQEQGTQQLKELASELNKQMDLLNTNIAFDFSDEIDRLYLRVLEKNTGKLIREFPSEEARALAGYFRNAVGLLFDKES